MPVFHGFAELSEVYVSGDDLVPGVCYGDEGFGEVLFG